MDIKTEREKRKLSQQELADNTGISKERIAKWEQRKSKPKVDDFVILEKYFKDNVPEDSPGIKEKAVVSLDTSVLIELINKMADGNNKLIESGKVDAESRKIDSLTRSTLATTNADLTVMLKLAIGPTGGGLSEILSEMNATMQGISDTVVLVATGKKFESEQDAADMLHKNISGYQEKIKQEGNLHTSDR